MEPAEEKGQRRKLKRVVQKKKKLKLNNSASVVYYKKVKAALNVSLNNTLKVSQTLKANNSALAQSLQRVKQELRQALNDNGQLKVLNQELTIKVLRLETQLGQDTQQNNYEQRLRGLKGVLNSMSHHLLELGNCVSDGMDLCLLSPRTSHTTTSPPALPDLPDTLGEGQDTAVSSSPFLDEDVAGTSDSVAGGSGVEWGGAGKLMTPDMSIIMEQSILPDQDSTVPSLDNMPSVQEEGPGSSSSSLPLSAGSKKASVFTKLPQRVRLASGEGSQPPRPVSQASTSATASLSQPRKLAKGTNSNCFAIKSPPAPRRATFVVKRGGEKEDSESMETASSGSLEDITSIPMPDLVSASPMKDPPSSQAFLPDEPPVTQALPQDTDSAVFGKEGKKKRNKSKPAVEADQSTASHAGPADSCGQSGKGEKGKTGKAVTESEPSSTATSSKERRKSAGKKKDGTSTKATKPPVSKVGNQCPNDTEFFISNPCALNLVHKRVTGSSEGSLEPAAAEDRPQPSQSLEEFMAHIRESNRKSSKLASLFGGEGPSAVHHSPKPAPHTLGPALTETEPPDHTMYFDSDMDFTQVLPQSNIHLPVAEQQTATAAVKRDSKACSRRKDKGKKDKREEEESPVEEKAGEDGGEEKGGEKKLAVALRVSKPGQMVFAASRKEEDGSRKAIPAKLQTKARSKSKKQVEEMARALPPSQPQCVFDFHDQTPRPAAQQDPDQPPPKSVFDLSLNDTLPGVPPSLASVREKLKGIRKHLDSTQDKPEGCEAMAGDKSKAGFSGLLGDAPVYALPLKDSSSPSPRPVPRPRSSSRGRQSRSKSRSRQDGQQDKENDHPQHTQRSSRSKSGSRAADKTADHQTDADGVSKQRDCDVGNRGNTEDSEDKCEATRRSGRSRQRKTYTEDDTSLLSSPQEKVSRARSRGRVTKGEEDEEYRPVLREARSRSRHRKTEDETGSPSEKEGTENNPLQQRGQSRSRPDKDEESTEKETEAESASLQQRGRSRSRHRPAETKESIEDTEAESESLQDRGRSRSRRRPAKDEESTEKETEAESTSLQQRGRSRSRRKPAKDEESTEKETEGESASLQQRGRSRSRRRPAKDEESTEKETEGDSTSLQHRGRSRRRPAKDEESTEKETEGESTSLQNRGRSRSRRRPAKNDELGCDDGGHCESKLSLQRGRSRSQKRLPLSDIDDIFQTSTAVVHQDSEANAMYDELPGETSHQSTAEDRAERRGEGKTGAVSGESDDSDKEPLRLITDRRHRSKSCGKKLYSQGEGLADPFSFSDNLDEKNSETTTVPEKKRHRTRSRGETLLNDKELKKQTVGDSRSGDLVSNVCVSKSSPVHHEGLEKRKVSKEPSEDSALSGREGSPSKRVRKSSDDNERSQPVVCQETDTAASKAGTTCEGKSMGGVAAASLPHTARRRSSLPIAVAVPHAVEQDEVRNSPAVSKMKARSRGINRLADTVATDKQQPVAVDELKRRLKELEPSCSSSGNPDQHPQPVKKSRPLVLPTASSSKSSHRSLPVSEEGSIKGLPRSKKGKSQPGSPRGKREGKSHPGSPRGKREDKSHPASPASSPRLSDCRASLPLSDNSEESLQGDGRRGRRAAAAVCYKEPTLNKKLRRGDPQTTFLHRQQTTPVYKSPKTPGKRVRCEGVERGALHDLTNQSILETDAE